MKDKLFESHYKPGFDHFMFKVKKLLDLNNPQKEVQLFYLVLITLILTISILLG